MRERADTIARTLTMEQGKPLAEAKAEVLHSADTFEWFAEEGKRAYGQMIPNSVPGKRHVTLKHPVGVVGGHQSLEFSDHAPSTQNRPGPCGGLHHRLRRPARLRCASFRSSSAWSRPACRPGVANLVIGPAQEMADEFLENPIVRKISFTGSTEVGKQLMRGAAEQMKRLSLELGGHAPFIVFPDADPEAVAKIAVMGKFRNNGQVCISPSRFFVHKDVEKKFTEAAVEFAKALKLGNGLEPASRSGRCSRRKRWIDTQEPGRGCEATWREGAHRRQEERPFRSRLFLRADRAVRPVADAQDHDRGAVRPGDAADRFQELDDVIRAANNTRTAWRPTCSRTI